MDFGEPSCFACGFMATDPDEPAEIWAVWNRALLERCHLVPAALGGRDEPSNLVLLCRQCHFDAPDAIDPGYMLRWIEHRESWGVRRMAILRTMMEAEGLADDEIYDDPLEVHRMAQALMSTWCGAHGYGVSESTTAALYIEAIKRVRAAVTEDELPA